MLTLRVEETTKMRKGHREKGENGGYYEKDHFGSNRFFSVDFTINHLNEGQPKVGQWSYPFSIKLPEWLPASMTCATGYNKSYCGIEYSLIAQFIPAQDKDWVD